MIVRLAKALEPFKDTEITADVLDVTFLVFTVNVTDVLPAGTVTVVGTIAEEWSEAIATTAPPTGAGPLIVIFPVEDLPPATVVGVRVNDVIRTGLIVRDAD